MPSVTDFFFPPRPAGSVTAGDLDYYERTGGWLAQPKFNESRILTHVLPSGEVVFWTRHGHRPTNIDAKTLSLEVKKHLHLTPGVEYWVDGGVMNREKSAGGELVFYDILWQDKYLFLKTPQEARLGNLLELCGFPKELNAEGTALKIGDHLWLSVCFWDEFKDRLKSVIQVPYVEGLVLRKKDSQIDNYGKKQYEASWMKRCRVK